MKYHFDHRVILNPDLEHEALASAVRFPHAAVNLWLP